MRDIIRLMRLRHWIKNILLFIPAFFAGNLWETDVVRNLVLGFACFGMVSSVVYIFNDLKDIEKDRRHEVKCKRPLASGAVSIKTAWYMILFLGVFAIVLSKRIVCQNVYLPMIWCISYLILNVAYSIGLKNLPIVDVAILASGFIIRVFYGAAISNVIASSWLCLTVMAFALYMGIGKRRNEIQKTGDNKTRSVLQYYDMQLLDRYMIIVATLGCVFYSLWAGMVIDNRWAIWTVPLVLMIVMKYEMVIRKDSFGDPVEVLLSDHVLCGLIDLYAVLMFLFTYVLV